MQDLYSAEVNAPKAHADGASTALDNAFAFIEEAFGDDREMAAFVAELTARPAPAHFIGRFGSEAYYAHNASAVPGATDADLLTRIERLDLEAAAAEAAKAEAARNKGCGGGCC